jgi:hypothetical protein
VDTLIDRRKYTRLSQEFPVKAKVLGTPLEVEGVTLDVSQGGAFVLSLLWSAFQANDQTEIQFTLPPAFTGQKESLLLRGGVLLSGSMGTDWVSPSSFCRS